MDKTKGCIFNIQRFSLHDGPGIRTSIFFKGCPLRCSWCSNPESQNSAPEPIWDNVKKKEVATGEYITTEELMTIIRKDMDYYAKSQGGITVTGGEPLVQNEFVIQLLQQCQKENIHTACETSGYSSEQAFQQLINNVDLLIMDLKHHDTEKHQAETGVPLKPILENLQLAVKSKKELLVRIPIIPGFNSTSEDAHAFANLLKKYDISAIELLPFHQFGKNKYRSLNRPYAFEDAKQLDAGDLIFYQEIIKSYGIDCLLD